MILPITATLALVAIVVNEVRAPKRTRARRMSGPAPVRRPDTWSTRGK